MSEIVPEFDLFGGVYSLPPEMRLLERFSLRLSPSQKARFFSYASGMMKTPSEVLRDYVLSLVGDY